MKTKTILLALSILAVSNAQASAIPEAKMLNSVKVVAVTLKKEAKNYCINGPCFTVVSYKVYAKVEAFNSCAMNDEFVKEESIRVDNSMEIKLSGIDSERICPMHMAPVYKTVLVGVLPEPRPAHVMVNGVLAK